MQLSPNAGQSCTSTGQAICERVVSGVYTSTGSAHVRQIPDERRLMMFIERDRLAVHIHRLLDVEGCEEGCGSNEQLS